MTRPRTIQDDASDWWDHERRLRSLEQPASALFARVERITDQTIANSPAQPFPAISFGSVIADDLANPLWNVATPTRLTALVDGLYLVEGGVEWAANATGARFAGLRRNGDAVRQIGAQHGPNAATNNVIYNMSVPYRLSAGDYVELTVWQNSGGNLNVLGAGNVRPHLSLTRISP